MSEIINLKNIKMQKVVLFILVMMSISIYAQNNNDILLTIDGNKITRGEFERIYTKNNKKPSFDSTSLAEYMNLFINFKLKVIEAEELGMDTLKSFKSELRGYKSQLEKPYFTDESVDEQLMKEAYERMQWDIRASHILIRCSSDALPADTLKTYNKAAKIRREALSGKDFSELADMYLHMMKEAGVITLRVQNYEKAIEFLEKQEVNVS